MFYAILYILTWCLNSDGALVVVNPAVDTPVPLNSAENVTYTCNVTGDNSSGVLIEAVWAVQGIQVPDEVGRMRYAGLGVFITQLSAEMVEVVVSERGRSVFGGSLELQCIGTEFQQSGTIMLFRGTTFLITSYGESTLCECVCNHVSRATTPTPTNQPTTLCKLMQFYSKLMKYG